MCARVLVCLCAREFVVSSFFIHSSSAYSGSSVYLRRYVAVLSLVLSVSSSSLSLCNRLGSSANRQSVTKYEMHQEPTSRQFDAAKANCLLYLTLNANACFYFDLFFLQFFFSISSQCFFYRVGSNNFHQSANCFTFGIGL